MRAITFALSACLALAACAAGSSPPETSQLAQLPAIAELDGIKSGSAVFTNDVVVFNPLARANTEVSGSGLAFSVAPPAELAWAIYRIAYPEPLYELNASGSKSLWLAAADYGSGTWSEFAPLVNETGELDLTDLDNPISPDGYVYVAVVAAPGFAGVLRAMSVTHDLPADYEHVYYVSSNTGNDANSGSQGAPWQTLQHAADIVQPGDKVVVQGSTHSGFQLQTSGTPGFPIVFEGGSNARIITPGPNGLDGINIENWGEEGGISHVVIAQLNVSGMPRTGIRVAGSADSFAHHITVRHCTLDSNGTWGVLTGHADDLLVENNICSNSGDEHGIYLSNSGDRNVARGNLCFGNNACGIQFNADASLGADGTMSDALVENNVLYDNGAAGGSALNTDGLRRCVIRNNLIYGNHASGIVLYNGDGVNSGENLVVNNTVVMPADGRWCINIGSGSTGNRVYNNILWNEHSFRGSITLDESSVAGFASDYNCVVDRLTADDGSSVLTLAEWQAQYGWDTHSIVAEPALVFLDADNGNYQLPSFSPARDIGLLEIAPPFDMSLVERPQGGGVDLGCFESN